MNISFFFFLWFVVLDDGIFRNNVHFNNVMNLEKGRLWLIHLFVQNVNTVAGVQ